MQQRAKERAIRAKQRQAGTKGNGNSSHEADEGRERKYKYMIQFQAGAGPNTCRVRQILREAIHAQCRAGLAPKSQTRERTALGPVKKDDAERVTSRLPWSSSWFWALDAACVQCCNSRMHSTLCVQEPCPGCLQVATVDTVSHTIPRTMNRGTSKERTAR